MWERKNKLTDCHFCYLRSYGQAVWKFAQFNPSSLLPGLCVVFFFLQLMLIAQEWDLHQAKNLIIQNFLWLEGVPTSLTCPLSVREHWRLPALEHKVCLGYFCNISASLLSCLSCSVRTPLFSACALHLLLYEVTDAPFRKHIFGAVLTCVLDD